MIKENYNITLEEAKEMDIYKFAMEYPLEELIRKVHQKDFTEDREVPVVMEFGNIDIELTIYMTDEGNVDLGYYVCIKTENDWDSYDYSDKMVVLNRNLEREMFEELMCFAKENNLLWSQPNRFNLQ